MLRAYISVDAMFINFIQFIHRIDLPQYSVVLLHAGIILFIILEIIDML